MRTSLLGLSLTVLASGAASAQTLQYTLEPSSSVTLGAALDLAFAGDLRGAFDPQSNPGGTRTIAGLFGDPGTNARIPVALTLQVDGLLGGDAFGGFSLDLADGAAVGEVDGLALDLVPPGGGPAGASLTLVLEFDTFRTVAPQSLYIGGIALPIPLGGVDVTDVVLTQSAPVPATISDLPGAPAGTAEVAALVPCELSFSVELGGILGGGGGGAPTPVGPLPIALPLRATVDLADCGGALSSAVTLDVDETIPSPIPIELTDLPLDLPTLLPPGETANLLLDASLQDLALEGAVDATLDAVAPASDRFVDVCDGVLNSLGQAAEIAPIGTASLLAGDFGLQVTGMPSDVFGMLIMSRSTDFMPGFGGSQGTLCLGEPCFRFDTSVMNSGPLGEVALFPGTSTPLPGGQAFAAGERWNFQYWYRDVNPGSTSNTSGSIGVLFCR